MRFILCLFLTFFSVQALHAKDLNSALSELDNATSALKGPASNWQLMLDAAKKDTFEKSSGVVDCEFLGSAGYVAPDWICDAPVAGLEYSSVGLGEIAVLPDEIKQEADERGRYINKIDSPIKAYISALGSAKAMINAAVNIVVHKDEVTEKVKDDVSKQITTVYSDSGNTSLKQMVKQYVEYDDKGVEQSRFSAFISKLAYKDEDCKMLITEYVSVTDDGEPDIAEKMISSGGCGFHKVVEDMAASGWLLAKMIRGPDNTYYTLVGYVQPQDKASTSENDKALWQQFREQQNEESLWKQFKVQEGTE